jgi:PEP-CTERM motif
MKATIAKITILYLGYLISSFLVKNPSLAATFSINLEDSNEVQIFSGTINDQPIGDQINSISGEGQINPQAFPIIPILKLLVWSGKNTPLGSLQSESMPSMLELANGDLSGNMFVGDNLFATFEQTTNTFNSTVFKVDSEIPFSESTFSMFISETYTSSGFGSVIGEGYYSVGNFSEDYRVEYNLDGNVNAFLPMSYTRILEADFSLVDNDVIFEGITQKPIPEPSSTLGLLGLGIIGITLTLKRQWN